MNSEYCVVDIEATGGNHKSGRIIEIGIVKIRNRTVVSEFSTLINPEQRVDKYVSKLTGIADKDLVDAPLFEDVADTVVSFLGNSTFVGHNAAFDYTYLRAELRKIGINYVANQLCTIDLSRILLLGEESYSLGKLCRSLGLEVADRHRALGDANATALLLLHLMKQEGFKNAMDASKRLGLSAKSNPKGRVKMTQSAFTKLPDEPGIFYLKDKNGNTLYVGRGESIKKSASKIFSVSKRYERFREHQDKISSVSFELTGNELLAELLFYKNVLEKPPLLNIHIKQLEYRYSLNVYTKRKTLKVGITRVKDQFGLPISYFKDFKTAEKELSRIIRQYQIEPKNYEIKLNRVLKTQVRRTEEELLKMSIGSPLETLINDVGIFRPNGIYAGHGKSANEWVLFKINNGKLEGYKLVKGAIADKDLTDSKVRLKPLDFKDGAKICWHFFQNTNQYEKVL